ncbi:MAG: phosphoglycerate kinase [Chlamydiae bacterium]|nr:phosphoglycerate kinase [Chlamydiota bacterium]
MNKLSLKDLDVKNKKVLIRVDFNVPLTPEGLISDATRIQESLPSIEYVLKSGGSVILMSHMGRPKGKKDPAFSLTPCAKYLSALLKIPVKMAPDCIGEETETLVKNMYPGQVILLENLRFYPAEEKPELDPSFAKNLAKLGDIYVNDAFGTAHRKHSSTAVIAQYFPGKAAAGFLLEKEISALSSILLEPKQPFFAIVGGSKISSKMGVLLSLATKTKAIFIGGGMSYTFMKARGLTIGDSIHEDDQMQAAKNFTEFCKNHSVELFLPIDLVVASTYGPDAPSQVIQVEDGIPDGFQGMDIGPKTRELWQKKLLDAKTIFWNGPLGVFEFLKFSEGTFTIARTIASLPGCSSIVGGGDSVAAINQLGIADKFTHISTGGGASLEFIEFGNLPGIEALSKK